MSDDDVDMMPYADDYAESKKLDNVYNDLMATRVARREEELPVGVVEIADKILAEADERESAKRTGKWVQVGQIVDEGLVPRDPKTGIPRYDNVRIAPRMNGKTQTPTRVKLPRFFTLDDSRPSAHVVLATMNVVKCAECSDAVRPLIFSFNMDLCANMAAVHRGLSGHDNWEVHTYKAWVAVHNMNVIITRPQGASYGDSLFNDAGHKASDRYVCLVCGRRQGELTFYNSVHRSDTDLFTIEVRMQDCGHAVTFLGDDDKLDESTFEENRKRLWG